MRRKFYVASSRDGLPQVLDLTARLEALGWDNTFGWPEHFNHVCSTGTCGIGSRQELAWSELRGVRLCDVFIGIARMGKGSNVELGAALILGRRIILVGMDPRDSVFYDADGVTHVASIDDVVRLLTT